MLNIRQVKHLAARLDVSVDRLIQVANSPESFCEELTLLDPAKPEKPRDVLNVQGDLEKIESRMLRGVLMPNLRPSPFSHGSIKGRHIKTNVAPHMRSVFVFTTDISNFYPTISRNRVYRLFDKRFGCSPDVARLCTRLCTYRHHLALGLITSPFLADQVLLPVDRRIAAACTAADLVYTRYVDDISISGSFDLERSGFEAVVQDILDNHGFTIHPDKSLFGRLSKGTPITKIIIRRGHADVRRVYLEELDRQLNDAIALAAGGEFQGPYYTRTQISGRVQFVCWVNRGRRRKLFARFNAVPWNDVAREASRRGFVAAKKKLVKRDALVTV